MKFFLHVLKILNVVLKYLFKIFDLKLHVLKIDFGLNYMYQKFSVEHILNLRDFIVFIRLLDLCIKSTPQFCDGLFPVTSFTKISDLQYNLPRVYHS